MIDIVSISSDLSIFDAQTSKGKNVLSVQLGRLEYAPDFGIDLEFFIQEDFQFQNDSFKAYLIQRLTEHHVNVNQVIQVMNALYESLTFVVGDADKNTGGFIR